MSVTSGFFNSQNGDRKYNAEHFGSIFAGIIRDGVFANYPNTGDELKVTAVSGAMKVQVGPGRCWFKNTWLDNNSNLQFNVPAADSNQARTDAVVVDINLTNDVRRNDIKYITGQVGGGNPTLANGNGHYQYVLAYVQVPAGATAPTVVGQVGVNKPTPYITGPLQTVSADNVLAQWQNAVNARIDAELAEYLGSIGEDIPVAFTQTASGIQCLYTFEEIKTAYNSNNAGITASFNHYSHPNTKLVSKEFKVLGTSNNVTGFVFYFYEPGHGYYADIIRLGRRFAVMYTNNSAPTVIDIEHPKSKVYYCIERYYDTDPDGFDGTSYLPKKGLTKTGLVVSAIQGADTNDPADYPRAGDIVIGSTGAIAKVTNVYDDGYMFVFDALGIDTMHTSVIVATFQSSPASCDVSYADLAAAIQAKQPITAIYQYRIGARSYTIYADSIGSITNAIGVEFKLPAGTAKFEYTSSGITYAIEYEENKTPYVLEFIGGPSGQPGTNGMFNEVLSAYNNDRPIIAKMEDTNGAMRVTSMYEVASDSSSVTFYFVSIVPTSGSTPSSWTYKCIVYRIMQDDTVIYSGN